MHAPISGRQIAAAAKPVTPDAATQAAATAQAEAAAKQELASFPSSVATQAAIAIKFCVAHTGPQIAVQAPPKAELVAVERNVFVNPAGKEGIVQPVAVPVLINGGGTAEVSEDGGGIGSQRNFRRGIDHAGI